MRKILFFINFITILIILSSCSNDSKPETLTQVNKDTLQEETFDIFSLNYPEIKYQTIHINDISILNKIKNKYQDSSATLRKAYIRTLETLNRKDLAFFRVGQDIIVPDSIIDDMRAYSIFPDDYPGAKKIEKLKSGCKKIQI